MERFNELHKDIVERAMRLILEFGDGNHQLELAELIKTTRYRLMNFANTLLGLLPPAAGRPEVVERIRHQYAALFLQRTDGALQDIEIGFIGGQKVASTAKVEAAPKLSDALTLKPTFMGLSFDLQQGWKWVRNWWQRTRC
jgi:hypothetical protein